MTTQEFIESIKKTDAKPSTKVSILFFELELKKEELRDMQRDVDLLEDAIEQLKKDKDYVSPN